MLLLNLCYLLLRQSDRFWHSNHLQMNLSAMAIQSSFLLLLSSSPVCTYPTPSQWKPESPDICFHTLNTLATHWMRWKEVQQRERAHFMDILYSDVTNVPISSIRSYNLPRLIIHSFLSLIINDVEAGCIILFLQHNTGVQAASDRGNCSSYRSEFITSPVRVPGFFIIPKIYHVIYAVTLSWCV